MSDWPDRLLLFGGTGDLASRSLFPALVALHEDGVLPESLSVLATGRRAVSDDDFRAKVAGALDEFAPDAAEASRRFVVDCVAYRAADLTEPDCVAGLLDALPGDGPVLAYLALPPTMFDDAIVGLRQGGFPEGSRFVIEKPFGDSLASARALNALLHEHTDERSIFRVDHFLNKQTAQNVLGLRFANRIFEPVWSNAHIEKVEITFDETLALEDRAGYYDKVGALVDMIQNHLLQLLSLVAMDPPATMDGDDFRDRKVSVLRAVRADVEHSVRARYAGYTEEEGVDPERNTETFAAVTLWIDNWRWAGVPFVLRSGKALAADRHEIAVHFRPVPHLAFGGDHEAAPNVLRLAMSPDGACPDRLTVTLATNADGDLFGLQPLTLEADLAPAERQAYANVLVHAFEGDPTFAIRADEAEELWRIVAPVVDAWRGDHEPVDEYPIGSSGPEVPDPLNR